MLKHLSGWPACVQRRPGFFFGESQAARSCYLCAAGSALDHNPRVLHPTTANIPPSHHLQLARRFVVTAAAAPSDLPNKPCLAGCSQTGIPMLYSAVLAMIFAVVTEPVPAGAPSTLQFNSDEHPEHHDCSGHDCTWTAQYACPGAPFPGTDGYVNDTHSSHDVHCCCVTSASPPPESAKCSGKCHWTDTWACPGSAFPGSKGYATDDGSKGFACCCGKH